MVTKTMHFSVCGEGLTGIVRQMYCFEGKKLQALNILENLQGIDISQSKDVCEGRALGKKPHRSDSIRPIYQIDELEEQRRSLHIAMLSNAGFMPLECGHAATAFKMVIEHFIEERMKRLGLL